MDRDAETSVSGSSGPYWRPAKKKSGFGDFRIQEVVKKI
jgi:hypothetical protein